MNHDTRNPSSSVDRTVQKPPDGGWGWIVTFSSFMHNVLLDGICMTVGVFYLEFLAHFKGSKGKTQLLSSVINGTYSISGPLAAALVNKFVCRKIAISGAVTASARLFLSTFSPNLDTMIVLYGAVSGFGLGLTFLPAIVMVGIYFEKRRSLATGISVCGSGIGSFVFATLSAYLIQEYGWQGAMWILSGIVLNGVIFAASYRPLHLDVVAPIADSSDESCSRTCEMQALEKNEIVIEKQSCEKISSCLNNWPLSSQAFLLFGFTCCLCGLGIFIPFSFLPAYAASVEISTSRGALLISITGISSTVSRVLTGLVSDQPWTDPIYVNSIALFLGGILTCFVPYYKTYGALVSYSVLIGACVGANAAVRSIVAVVLQGAGRLSTAFGIISMCEGVFAFLGSPIAGALADITGDYSAAFYLSGITLALSGLFGFPVRKFAEWEHKRNCEIDIDTATTKGVYIIEETHM